MSDRPPMTLDCPECRGRSARRDVMNCGCLTCAGHGHVTNSAYLEWINKKRASDDAKRNAEEERLRNTFVEPVDAQRDEALAMLAKAEQLYVDTDEDLACLKQLFAMKSVEDAPSARREIAEKEERLRATFRRLVQP